MDYSLNNKEFPFAPAPWLPQYDLETLNKCRNIAREDMEYTNENGFSVKIVIDPTLHYVMDLIHRIYMSDVMDKKFTMICPNQWRPAYTAVANMINMHNINCRNVHAFAMDEFADQDGNVAPLTYGAGLGYNFLNCFYYRIREDLRPPIEQWHVFTNENKGDGVYSKIIEDVSEGGVDIIYSATGWPGHTAFIDPGAPEFAADSLEEFITLDSRVTTCTPLTIVENSTFRCMGGSGDVWGTPPRAVTIGPKDVVTAKERLELHNLVSGTGGESWQRMISRIELYGPITKECPASILRLGKGTCYVSEILARPFAGWTKDVKDWEL